MDDAAGLTGKAKAACSGTGWAHRDSSAAGTHGVLIHPHAAIQPEVSVQMPQLQLPTSAAGGTVGVLMEGPWHRHRARLPSELGIWARPARSRQH